MATVSFDRDWTLTEEQAEKLAKVLEKPPTRVIPDEQVQKFEKSLERGEAVLNLLFTRYSN